MLVENLTVAICTKNESDGIQEVIESCKPFCNNILVVDGHSTDNTVEKAKACGAAVILDGGKGKGDGIRTAIDYLTDGIIVFIDGDLSHEAKDIPLLAQPIIDGQSDLVIGSRKRGGSDELHGSLGEFIRLTGSGIITLSINYRFGVRLTDTQNGFRSISVKAAKKLNLKEDIFTIEQEMVMKALKKGYRVFEVPSHEYRRKYGNSKIVIHKVAVRYVWTLLKYLI
jgi:dolichol-phosphate mannosyltransferase